MKGTPQFSQCRVHRAIRQNALLLCRTKYGESFSVAELCQRSEDSMSEGYIWQAAYQAAVLETDNAAIALRIYEALAAIEQRRLSYLDIGEEENRALEDAEQGLLALKAERIDPSGTK
jgi:hypothetical protein